MGDPDTGTSMFPPPINPGNPGRGPLIMGLSWTLTVLATMVLTARVLVRVKVARHLSPDDWFMMAAGVFNIAFTACLTEAYRWGLGKHDRDMTYQQLVNTGKWVWISTSPGICASITARISVAILLVRIFGSKTWLKWFLITITILQSVANAALMVLIWFQVRPVQGLWDVFAATWRLDPRVQIYLGYVASSLFTFGDLAYVLFPVMVVWKLNMPLHRKIGLCVLLAVSCLTMAVSLVRTIEVQGQTTSKEDAQYNACLGSIWSLIEQTIVIMMGCVPPLSSVTKMKLSPIRSFFSSLRRVISKPDKGYGSQHTERLDDSFGHASYYELGNPGHNVFQVRTGTTDTLAKQGEGRNTHDGRIHRTDQFTVSSGNMEE